MPRRISNHEEMICRKFIERINQQRPWLIDRVFHIPNGGKRTKAEAGMFKAMGTRRGVSDYFIMRQSGGYAGLWIEVKSPGGTVSRHQKEFIKQARNAGYAAAVAWGLDEVWEIFTAYMDGHTNGIQVYLNSITLTDRKIYRRQMLGNADESG